MRTGEVGGQCQTQANHHALLAGGFFRARPEERHAVAADGRRAPVFNSSAA